MAKTTILSGSGALVAAMAGGVAWLVLRRPKTTSRSKAPRGSGSGTDPTPSPFVEGSHCTVLVDDAQLRRWIDEVVVPVMGPKLDAYAVARNEHVAARRAIRQMIDEVYQATTPECRVTDSAAAQQVWKGLWCDAVLQLIERGKVDEEPDDLLRLCADPSFDPRTLPIEEDATEPPRPPIPRPVPLEPPRPVEPTRPLDASTPPPSRNLWQATTRGELAEIGLMRLMEGTAAGAPIKAPSAHLVLFAFNPAWPGLREAQGELGRLAAEHPRLTFVKASFADTQRHFGKPEDLHALSWALAAAGPDGRVFPEPIVGRDLGGQAPTAEQWAKMIAHASGFVGAPQVVRLPRPRRFGDLLVAMVSTSRPRASTPRPRRTRSRPSAPVARRRSPRSRRRGVG